MKVDIQLVDNARHVLRFMTTWLSIAGGSAALGVIAVLAFPKQVLDLVPHWLLVVMATIAAICAFLVPLASVIKQQFPESAKPAIEITGKDSKDPEA